MQVKELIIFILNGINITNYYDQKKMTGASLLPVYSLLTSLLNVN